MVVVPAGIVLDLPIPGAKGTPASHSAVYSLTDELRLLHHGVDGKAAGWGPAVIVFPTYFPASSSASNGLSSGNDNSQRNYISNNALPVIYPLPNATKETREMFGVGDICAANAHDQSHELRKEWDHHDYKGTKSMLLQEISHIPTIWNQGPKFVNKEQAVAVITVEDEPGHVRKVEIGRTLVDVDNDVNEIKNKRIHFRRNVVYFYLVTRNLKNIYSIYFMLLSGFDQSQHIDVTDHVQHVLISARPGLHAVPRRARGSGLLWHCYVASPCRVRIHTRMGQFAGFL